VKESSMEFIYKQVLVIRTDIKMSPGKKVVQGAHASILASEAARKLLPGTWQSWYHEGQRKIACKVDSREALFELKARAEQRNLPCAVVADAGLTELEPGTVTALGIGPAKDTDIDPVTGDLPLL